MTVKYIATGKHVSAEWAAKEYEIEVRSNDSGKNWHAVAAGLGCGKDRNTPLAAALHLMQDHAYYDVVLKNKGTVKVSLRAAIMGTSHILRMARERAEDASLVEARELCLLAAETVDELVATKPTRDASDRGMIFLIERRLRDTESLIIERECLAGRG